MNPTLAQAALQVATDPSYERAWRWLERHLAATLAFGTACYVVLIVLFFAVWSALVRRGRQQPTHPRLADETDDFRYSRERNDD